MEECICSSVVCKYCPVDNVYMLEYIISLPAVLSCRIDLRVCLNS